MLFHVTAKHEVTFCAAYDKPLQKEVGEAWGNLGKLSEELGVKVKSWGLDAPGHTIFMVLEAESVQSLSKFLLSNPMRQDYDVRPLLSLDEIKGMIGNIGPNK